MLRIILILKSMLGKSSQNVRADFCSGDREIFSSVIPTVYLRTKLTNTCRKAVKNTTIIVIYKVLVYIQMSQPTTCFGLF